MSGYAAVSDIIGEFKSIAFGSSTSITSASVSEIITQEASRINLKVGVFYSVPVSSATSPISFSVLKALNTKLTKHRVESIIRTKSGAKLDGEPTENLETKAMAEIDAIIQSRLLIDATRNSSKAGIEDFNSKNSYTPDIDYEQVQW